MSFTLFVGSNDAMLAQQAHAHDTQAVLIDQHNVSDFMSADARNCTAYTSLEDLSGDIELASTLFHTADHVVYVPESWPDVDIDVFDLGNTAKGLTYHLLSCVHQTKHNVTGLCVENINTDAPAARQCQGTQIWVAGCSFSHDYGVTKQQTYAGQLSEQLQYPVSLLTHPGSSIGWAADQILRADIRPGDIVVWGLTTERRFHWWHDHDQLLHFSINWHKFARVTDITDLQPLTVTQILHSNHVMIAAICEVEKVINYCNKIGAKLLVMGLLDSMSCSAQLQKFPEYKKYHNPENFNKLIDTGNIDPEHPGILQHQHYAKFCLAWLNRLYGI
jgi:hypothetical protein